MEITENQTPETSTVSQNNYVTIEENIVRMKIVFDNASLPEIFEKMQTVGYTAEKINDLKAKLSQLENLQLLKNKEFAEQLAETEKVDKLRFAIDAEYVMHRKLTKILFKENLQALVALQLDKAKSAVFSAWIQQALSFYQQLSDNAELKKQVADIGISAKNIQDKLQALADLQVLKASLQRKEMADAQSATDARDKAFDELYPRYSEYLQYAKVLMPENQALEALGVVVR